MPKKKKDSLLNDALDIGKASLGIGITSQVVTGVGGNAAALQTAGSFMPVVGVAAGGKAVLKQVKKIKGEF